jgi:hypothetical protein
MKKYHEVEFNLLASAGVVGFLVSNQIIALLLAIAGILVIGFVNLYEALLINITNQMDHQAEVIGHQAKLLYPLKELNWSEDNSSASRVLERLDTIESAISKLDRT